MPEIPNLEWYKNESDKLSLSPRCKYTTSRRCPRYFQSIYLLGKASICTAMEPNEADRLKSKWEKTDIWPQVAEEETSTNSIDNKVISFNRFCPEVMYETFGYFFDYMHYYTNELDRDLTIRRLRSENVNEEDPKFEYQSFSIRHYSDCKVYSQLVVKEKNEDHVFELKPNFYGFGVDLKVLGKRIRNLIKKKANR